MSRRGKSTEMESRLVLPRGEKMGGPEGDLRGAGFLFRAMEML